MNYLANFEFKDIVNITTCPQAIVALAIITAITVCIVAYIRVLFLDK